MPICSITRGALVRHPGCHRRNDMSSLKCSNVGLFTFAAASMAGKCGHIVVIEADIWLADLLRRSNLLKSASRAKVEILPVAVSDSVGVGTFA